MHILPATCMLLQLMEAPASDCQQLNWGQSICQHPWCNYNNARVWWITSDKPWYQYIVIGVQALNDFQASSHSLKILIIVCIISSQAVLLYKMQEITELQNTNRKKYTKQYTYSKITDIC